MMLGRTLTDAAGAVHAMAGLLPVDTSLATRRLHLGHRRARWREAMPFAAAGAESLGREYHPAALVRGDAAGLADTADGAGRALPPAGHRAARVTGTFCHLVGQSD